MGKAGERLIIAPCVAERLKEQTMKDDLISRQALREEILRIAITTDDLYGMGVFEGLDRACKRINSAPSIKAAPVRHGRWLELHEENGHEMGICSRCHHERIIDNYCPNCGAKMDGGEEDVAD